MVPPSLGSRSWAPAGRWAGAAAPTGRLVAANARLKKRSEPPPPLAPSSADAAGWEALAAAGGPEEAAAGAGAGEWNVLCNRVLRAILGEDGGEVGALVWELDGQLDDDQAADPEARQFLHVLRGLLQHRLVSEADTLAGKYRDALEKMFLHIEDSGWQLEAEAGEQSTGSPRLDKEMTQMAPFDLSKNAYLQSG